MAASTLTGREFCSSVTDNGKAMSPSAQTPEWIRRDLSEPVGQGDIFKWVPRYQRDPWFTFGIIVTADCDIAHHKHWNSLSYCPVLRLRDFVRIFWLPGYLKKQHGHLLRNAAQAVSRMRRRYSRNYDFDIEEALILPWLLRRGAHGVAEDLSVPEGPDREKLILSLEILLMLDESLPSSDLREQLTALACARCNALRPGGDQLTREQQVIWRDLVGRAKQLPGDVFWLTELRHDAAGGFLACLRFIREIPYEFLAVDPIRERNDSSIRAVRVSRLNAPYRYRLTQQLASVFANIGLPSHYEQARTETMKQLGSLIGIPSGERETHE
ncbi:MAG: hypothetical protein IH965_14490 [Gemmatimonadetes bacterium]|nr:hypothetical protein [Gemmatimonadota bacterium]